MTPRDRIVAAIRHEETDYVPYVISIDPEVVQRLTEHYGSEDWRARIQGFVQGAGVQWRDEELGEGRWSDSFGVIWEDAPGPGAWHSVEVPLKEPTLEGYDPRGLRVPRSVGRGRTRAHAGGVQRAA